MHFMGKVAALGAVCNLVLWASFAACQSTGKAVSWTALQQGMSLFPL
jgi:hypothetical protein